MAIITIENKYGLLVVHEGQATKHSRLEWRGAGLEVYLVGSFASQYDQAANLAMNYAQSIHVPVTSMRRVGVSKSISRKKITSNSINMFGGKK